MRTIRLLALVEANTTTGPAKNLLQFAACLGARQAEPRVDLALAVFRRAGTANLFIDAARQSPVAVYPIDERRSFDFRVFPRLRAALREFQPDLIQSHAVKSHFLVRAGGLHRTAPWLAFHHGYTWPDVRARLYNQLNRWSLRGARKVLTVSSSFRGELMRFGVDPSRIEVIHNAIDPQWGSAERSAEARSEWRARLRIGPEEKVVVAVGRLSAEKDHRTLLLAAHRLRDSLRLRLVVVGDGPERERIVEMARELGLREGITLTGQVPSAAPYYGVADAAALSSRSEGSPNALLEAMAAGVPVVATSVGGIPEIVSHDRSALLVPPGDPAALARALALVLTDETLGRRLAKEAHDLVVRSYSPAVRTNRLVQIYAEVCGRP
ncbi:MAG: glycosyltransferase [Bryobacteraceae bacterium]|jgi:glycosyltransferase involved in cell wall biosynthesis